MSLTTDLPAQSEANSPAESRASNNGSNTLSAQSATQHGTEQAHQLDDDDEDDLLFDDDYVPGGGGVFEEAKRAGEAALGLLRQDSVVGVVAKSLAAARTGSGGLGGSSQLEPSSTTVTAATDVRSVSPVLYLEHDCVKLCANDTVVLVCGYRCDVCTTDCTRTPMSHFTG